MSEWREYGLAEVYNFASGLSKSSDQFGFGYGFVSFKDVFHNFFLPKRLVNLVNSTEKERITCSVRRGDVFLTRTSETQEELGMSSVAIYDYPDATFNGFTKRLRPLGIVDIVPEYAGYYFRSPKFRAIVTSMASITTRASLNNEMLASLKIVLPPLPEQTAIASILSSLDDKIDLLHRQNQTLEKMAETLFRQWFVVEAKEEWEEGTMEYFASFYNGKTRPKALGNIPVYGGNGILDYTTDFNYNGQSIIIGRVGAYCGSLYFQGGKIWVSDNALAVKSKIENSIYFLFYLFKSLDLNSLAEGSSHPLLTQTLLKSIEITIPPLEKIRSFNLKVNALHNKMDGNNDQIRTLTSMRDNLLPKLMSGEVRVDF